MNRNARTHNDIPCCFHYTVRVRRWRPRRPCQLRPGDAPARARRPRARPARQQTVPPSLETCAQNQTVARADAQNKRSLAGGRRARRPHRVRRNKSGMHYAGHALGRRAPWRRALGAVRSNKVCTIVITLNIQHQRRGGARLRRGGASAGAYCCRAPRPPAHSNTHTHTHNAHHIRLTSAAAVEHTVSSSSPRRRAAPSTI